MNGLCVLSSGTSASSTLLEESLKQIIYNDPFRSSRSFRLVRSFPGSGHRIGNHSTKSSEIPTIRCDVTNVSSVFSFAVCLQQINLRCSCCCFCAVIRTSLVSTKDFLCEATNPQQATFATETAVHFIYKKMTMLAASRISRHALQPVSTTAARWSVFRSFSNTSALADPTYDVVVVGKLHHDLPTTKHAFIVQGQWCGTCPLTCPFFTSQVEDPVVMSQPSRPVNWDSKRPVWKCEEPSEELV